MKAETKLSLTPSKCDDIEFFGEKMNVCADETITKVFFLFSTRTRFDSINRFEPIYSEYESPSDTAKKGFQIDVR